MAFRVLFFSDTHIGYSAKCRQHSSGLNQRVVDGYRSLEQVVSTAIAREVDLVLHGGDLFHRSWPTISDIAYTRRQLLRLHAAGIPFVGIVGNHDAAAERSKSPATAAVHDPDRGIDFVADPYRRVEPVDGFVVHALSHYALARAERIVPEPIDGAVNVLIAHGAAMVPDHPVFACVDSPGEQPIGVDVLTAGWDASLLGHYHGQGRLPGIGDVAGGQAWYAGSALRRGFSDPAGDRGALLVTVDGAALRIEPVSLWQRPQFDLDIVDAAGLTGADVHERVLAQLRQVDLAADGGAIVRQVVRNVTAAQRAAANLPGLAKAAQDALVWQPVLCRPDVADSAPGSRGDDSLATAGAVNMPTLFSGWVPGWADKRGLPPAVAATVAERGVDLLTEAEPVDVDPFTAADDVTAETIPEGASC